MRRWMIGLMYVAGAGMLIVSIFDEGLIPGDRWMAGVLCLILARVWELPE